MLLSTIVQTFVEKLFSGIQVIGCYQFRVTRNSDLFVDEEEVDDLRRALEGELQHRRYGAAVRLEIAHDCPEDLVKFLQAQFASNGLDIYPVAGPVNLNRLSAVYDLVQRPDLKYPIFTPGMPRRLVGTSDIFASIRQKRHPAASSLRELRAGDGLPAPGGRRPARARDQADPLPHRPRLPARRRARRRPRAPART